jgi:four helix bundle protein
MGGLKSDQWRDMEATTKPRSYKELLVWQKGVSLVTLAYKVRKEFPADERFGLVSQTRRAAVSVPSNLAESQSRRTTGEFVQFISQAEGSLSELETQMIISTELGFVSPETAQPLLSAIEERQKMVNSLRSTLATRQLNRAISRH